MADNIVVDTNKSLQPEKGYVIENIIIRPIQRITQDIKKWRDALQAAEGVQQYRISLYDLYADIILDSVLSTLIEKRILNVTKSKLVFNDASGKQIDDITALLQTAQFRELRIQILQQKFWGISVVELIREKDKFRIFNVDRKHIQPKEGKITFEQSGHDGILYREAPYNKFVIEVGRYDDFGLLLKAAPYVIFKRGGFGNWANFTQIFGMPFREARYSGYNEATRLQIEQALISMGSAGFGIFPDDAKMEFHEANNVQANGQLYDLLRKACNEELSMLILGQTGTTIQTPGKLGGENTNAQTEDDINADDRKFEISVMNEKVLPVLINLGYKLNGGAFAYEEVEEDIAPTEMATILNTLINQIKLPVDDDFIYEKFGIPKPANYNELKAQQEEERQALLNGGEEEQTPPNEKKQGKPGKKKLSGKNWLERLKDELNFFD